MSTPINDILRIAGLAPMTNSGLVKNVRKRRNGKIQRAFQNGGLGGLSTLLRSTEFNQYINSERMSLRKKDTQVVSNKASSLPGFDRMITGTGTAGWGKPPNVSPINYAEDDPRGWVTVTRNRRNRVCRIQDDEYYEDTVLC
jgi:hypothetical protein